MKSTQLVSVFDLKKRCTELSKLKIKVKLNQPYQFYNVLNTLSNFDNEQWNKLSLIKLIKLTNYALPFINRKPGW